MKLKSIFVASVSVTALVGATLALASSAMADSTGFDGIHGKIRVGNRVCFDGHSHGGTGHGASRKAAEMQAIHSWYGYTAGEYGSDWANIHKAIHTSMRCGASSGGWTCDVEATPCR